MTDNAAAAPFTFEVQATNLPANAVQILDDSSAAFTSNGLSHGTGSSWVDGTYQFVSPGTGSTEGTWTFSGLLPGVYQVTADWPGMTNAATNSPYTLYDGSTSLGTVIENQQVASMGVTSQGVNWQSLDVVAVSSGTLKVTLTNNANGQVEADAIRLVGPLESVQVAGSSNVPIVAGETTPSTTNDTDFGQATVGGAPVTQAYTISNTGTSTLNLTGSPLVSLSNTTDFTVTQPTVSSFALARQPRSRSPSPPALPACVRPF